MEKRKLVEAWWDYQINPITGWIAIPIEGNGQLRRRTLDNNTVVSYGSQN